MATPALTSYAPTMAGEAFAIGGHSLEVTLIGDLMTLATIAAEWITLESGAPAAVVFQGFALTLLWAQNFIVPGRRKPRLRIAVVSEDGRPKFILPIAVTTVGGIRVGRIAGAPVAQYVDAIAAQDDRAADYFLAAQRALSQDVDVLEFNGLRADSVLARVATGPITRPI